MALYVPHVWVNKTAVDFDPATDPALDSINLNEMEAGIYANSIHANSDHAPSDADNTAANETSHSDVIVDGDVKSIISPTNKVVTESDVIDPDDSLSPVTPSNKIVTELEGVKYTDVKTVVAVDNKVVTESDVVSPDDVLSPITVDNKVVTESDVAALGGGDMLKSIYDQNNNGIVDNAEKVNNLTVQTAVPLGALFTDHTYSVGDNGLTEVNFTTTLSTNLTTAYDHSQLAHAPSDADNTSTNETSHADVLVDGDAVSPVTAINKVITQDDLAALGGGDMLRLTYDTDLSGVVDNSQLVNGLTVLKAVPADAIFIDTTYSVGDGGLTEFNLSSALKVQYDSAYTHSQSAHAPSNAEQNTVEIDTVNVFQAAQRSNRDILAYVDNLTPVVPDFAASNRFEITLTGDVTISDPSNLVANQGGIIYIIQAGLGAYTTTWGSKFFFINTDDSTGVVDDVQIYAYEVYDVNTIIMTYVGVA